MFLNLNLRQALFVPDSDPLVFYTGILKKSVRLLDPQGKIYFEINEAMGNKWSGCLNLTASTEIQISQRYQRKRQDYKRNKTWLIMKFSKLL